MNKFLKVLVTLGLFSCAKQEFQANKTPQNATINPLVTTSTQLCSQHTLVSPKVDILMIWDNTSSFNFVTSATKSSMGNLISSVSEKFDYHILSVPMVPSQSTNLFESILVAKNSDGLTSSATNILKSKDQAIASLAFTQGAGGNERGVERAFNVITQNRSNGIFRNDAYTIIVVMSNEDDKGCEGTTGYSSCASTDLNNYLNPLKEKLLCLRGNSSVNCSSYGIMPLNSTMMRFINIAPLTACTNGLNKINTRYRGVAKYLYEAPYTNGWPTSNDNLNPFIVGSTQYPDNYNICAIDFAHIFDGVNTAIKQTLIKHVYEFWPVSGSSQSVDPDTIVVQRDDGKILTNRTGQSSPSDGYAFIGDQINHYTRTQPTQGENFTGKMIQLFGVNDNDKIVYPHCLTVTYNAIKEQFGYIYLKNGEPYVPTIEVRINGALVPQSATEGWDYMGLQYTSSLDSNYKIIDLPSGSTSGYFIRLNGSYKFKNTAGSSVNVEVYYTSKTTP